MQEETLEQVAHKILTDYGIKSMGQSIGVLEVKKLMVKMAKWQQKREKKMYSEEEDLLEEITVTPLTDEEANAIINTIGKSFGFTEFYTEAVEL